MYSRPALQGKSIACISSIAKPSRFTNQLEEAQGAKIKLKYTYPDHHLYTKEELQDVVSTAKSNGLFPIITTAKDMVKIPQDMQHNFAILDMQVNIDKKYFQKLETLLQSPIDQ